jgi:phosphatidylinositol alpha-1,6-mannosyltransferase
VSNSWSRAIIITPRCGGADGVSAVTRLYAQALIAQLGGGVRALEVWSLGDHHAAGVEDARVRFRAAAGRRARIAAFGIWQRGVDAQTLVVVQHVHLLPVALPLAWRGARIMLQLHGVEAWKPLRALERAGCRAAWKIAAVSAHTAVRFRQSNPDLAECPVVVCPPGLPLTVDAPRARTAAPYALIVARMSSEERYKGHDLLLDVWLRVRESVPEAILVIAGGGDDRARLVDKAAALGLANAVRFEGVVDADRLAALYRDAALFVMPSPNEGFGLVYVEAMSAGVPCVVATGAAEEIVEHGETGIVISPGDGAALERAVIRLLTSPSERERMGAAAAATARQRYSATAFARRIHDLLHLPEVTIAC